MKTFHIHLISDSTGETVNMLARAALVQFDDVNRVQHLWPMVRTITCLREVMQEIAINPGFVLYSVLDENLKRHMEERCNTLNVPYLSVLEPITDVFRTYFGKKESVRPGRQHLLNAEYFSRINALDFALLHDDGRSLGLLNDADVVLVGVSRMSKTPTCIYLGNKGIKAANVPLVPIMGTNSNVRRTTELTELIIPDELLQATHPLIIGLVGEAKQLVHIRRQRLIMLNQEPDTNYVDLDQVTLEIQQSRRLFTKMSWPVINIARKSIEETAATIIHLLQKKQPSEQDDEK